MAELLRGAVTRRRVHHHTVTHKSYTSGLDRAIYRTVGMNAGDPARLTARQTRILRIWAACPNCAAMRIKTMWKRGTRVNILIANVALAALSLIVMMVLYYQGYWLEMAKAMGLNLVVLNLPAFAIALWGRWLTFAGLLTILSIVLDFSLIVEVRFRVSAVVRIPCRPAWKRTRATAASAAPKDQGQVLTFECRDCGKQTEKNVLL
jgi:hypothetical protein